MNTSALFEREIGLIGLEGLNNLKHCLIVLFGLGGVGGYVFEALIRAGIENIIIIDKDIFDISNINRQLMATVDTISKDKVIVYADRAKKINSNVKIIGMKLDINDHVNDIFAMCKDFDNIKNIYAIDCIDDINAKIEIIEYCNKNNIMLISSMGTANHLDSTNIKIEDIYKTEYCPIAKIIRRKLKEINIKKLDVLYFDEPQIQNNELSTISYIPSMAGLKIAEYIIRKII